MSNIDDSEIRKVVIGRVEPHIYSFETNTLPNLLKVGDSYRPVEERLNEWRRYYKDLTEVSRHKALVSDAIFFRDHSVHEFLEANGKVHVAIDRAKNIYSKEFFEGVSKHDVANAVQDVIDSYGIPGKYTYYDSLKDRVEMHYVREKDFEPRGNQQEVISNFKTTIVDGRTNLLMYAVMRFGKSITSMWCAREIDSKLTIVVSAKKDVRDEWKQTVESHKDFAGYRFMESSDLTPGMSFDRTYGTEFHTGDGKTETCTNIVLFLTLQDLAGSAARVKEHHKILQSAKPDLLIIDETHFGARAQVLGKILAGTELNEEDEEALKDTDTVDDLGKISGLKPINARIKLHLSGTPYRILMGSEFTKQDIIAFVQFSDIYEAKMKWNADNLDKDEWKNPYFGFPQMIRFAFNPSEQSRKKLESIPGSKPSEIFAPVTSSKYGEYKSFAHEAEAIELLRVLDGAKHDTQLLGLLDHPSIKAGKLARHVVVVLPFRASCDAFEKLVTEHSELFKNLSSYKILNISGHNATLTKPEQIKSVITDAESKGEKTLTLTVNKMLTGTTVPEWDTMIYLKATMSPQEYDQAIFRLQSPWVKEYVADDDNVIKYDMKPQTLLVDLDPTRLFYLQEVKALSYGANTGKIGNENIEQFIARELKVSPVLAINAENNKLIEVTSSTIIDAVRRYASERSIGDDVNEIAVDISLRDHEDIHDLISTRAEISGKGGLNIKPIEGEGDEDVDTGDETGGEDKPDDTSSSGSSGVPSGDDGDSTAIRTFERQFRMYYVLILLFAFLSTTEEKSLADVITRLDANDDNRRIARSLGLRKEHLIALRQNLNWSILSTLDYKIQNSDYRALDDTISPVEHINIAINKFGKLSDSEVFTPASIVDKVYGSFDDDFWSNVHSARVLDIASKSGSFAAGFVCHATQHDMVLGDIKDNFYSIPTSPAAYEFTRKMYDALGLNIDNIAQYFTSYDLLDIEHPEAIATLLLNKKLCDITKQDLREISDKIDGNDSEGNQVRFSAIVGNPPYQATIEGRGDQPPIYHLFLEEAYKLSDKVAIIHPARFLFNAGLTPKPWNEKMLQDTHLKVEYFEQKSSKVFANTDIKGGIAITYRDTDKDFGAIGVFTSFPELNSILHKVEALSEPTLDTQITGRGVYRLTEKALSDYPQIEPLQSDGHKTDVGSGAFRILKDVILFDKKPSDNAEYVQIIGLLDGERKYLWIKREYLSEPDNFEAYKIVVPKANGSGAIGEILSTPLIGEPLIGEPLIGYTETFIGIGAYGAKNEAAAALKYIKSKFARTMLGVLKITQDNPRGKWAKVPVQNFTTNSDIDWTKPITEIDQQLYRKYNLSPEEIDFIETRVRAMG